MRNLKKVLSLVMALVMTLSLATSAFAATAATTTTETNSLSGIFTDASQIKNVDAVALLNSLNVLVGSDGKYNPTDTVTRAQAAKIICYLLLGTDVASSLENASTTSVFTDMKDAAWANGYVQYCATLGIITGYGDGTFGPNDKVTTYQFAKMLLAAAGYGQNDEFTGSAWATNVAVLAIKLGILPKGTMNADCTRDMTALYAYNTLFVDNVTYNTDKNTYDKKDGDGIALGTFASNNFNYGEKIATLLYSAAKGYYVDVDASGAYTANKDILVAVTDPTLIGQTVSVQAIGTTAMGGVTSKDVTLATSTNGHYTDLIFTGTHYVASLANTVTVVVNGTATPYTYTTTVAAGTTYAAGTATAGTYLALGTVTTAAGGTNAAIGDIFTVTALGVITVNFDSSAAIASGSVVSLIDSVVKSTVNGKDVYNTDNEIDKIIVTNKVAKVVGAKGVTTDVSGNVTIANTAISAVAAAKVVYPTGLAKDDVVLYYKDNTTNTYYVELAKSVDGTIASVNTAMGNVTVGTTKYDIAPASSRVSAVADYSALGGATATVYLDNNSNAVFVKSTAAPATLSSYLFVTATATSGILGDIKYNAAIILMDGTKATIQITKVDGAVVDALSDITANTFYTFTKDSSGNYLLTTVATQNAYTTSIAAANGTTVAQNDYTYNIDKNTVQFLDKLTAGAAATWATAVSTDVAAAIGTSATAFIYEGTVTNTLYTGIANVPDATGTVAGDNVYVLKDANGYALAVYSTLAASTTTTADVVYVTNTAATAVYKDSAISYYTFEAIVNGTATTVKAESGTAFATTGLYTVTSYDKDGYAATVAAATTTGLLHYDADVATSFAYNNGVLNVDTAYYALNSNVVFYHYYVDANGHEACETVTADQVKDMDQTTVTSVLVKETSPSDSTISAVYIVD
jgi:hypothetical protein